MAGIRVQTKEVPELDVFLVTEEIASAGAKNNAVAAVIIPNV